MQALGDGGGLDEVTSAKVAGDEMVEVSHSMSPSAGGHVGKCFLAQPRIHVSEGQRATG